MKRKEYKSMVFKLKKQGFSVSDISKRVNISKNTIYSWFKEVSPETIEVINLNKKARLKRLTELNEYRQTKLERYYQKAREEARLEFPGLLKDNLFVSGLTLYLTGGDRVSKYNLKMTNSDTTVLFMFINFLTIFLGVQRKEVRVQIFYDQSINPAICREFWSMNLKIEKTQFTKDIILNRQKKTKKSRYGNCGVGITSRFLKTKMLEWLVLFDREMRMRP